MHKLLSVLFLSVVSASAFAAEPVAITGLVAQPVQLSMDDLHKLAVTRREVVQMSGRGPVPLNCTGPTLATVLAQARLALPVAKNAVLRHTLLIGADDGYAVALSLGEIEPNYGDAAPLLATQCNGKQLDAPRLVMPGDKSAGRSVHGVVSIQVR